MNKLLLVAASTAIVVGAVWMLQGLNLFPHPANSMMIGQRNWALYGVVLVLFGLVVGFLALRR